MAESHKTREDDDRDLEMLHLRDRKLSRSQIGKRLGMTKNAVCGALFRIDYDLAKSEATEL